MGPIWSNPSLRRLQIAWAASWIEDWLLPFAIAVYAFDAGGAPAAALAGVVRMLPSAAGAPLLAVLVDRWPRRRVLCLAFGTQAFACFGMAATFWVDGPLSLIYGLLAIEGFVSVLIQPATSALLPWLTRTPSELTVMNASLTLLRSVGICVGPLLAAVILATRGAAGAFAVGGALMSLSFLATLRMPVSAPRPGASAPKQRFLAEMGAGYLALARDRAAGAIGLVLASSQGFIRGLFTVASVVVAVELLRADSSVAGYLQSASGFGGIVAGGVLSIVLRRTSLASAFTFGVVARTAPLALIALVPSPAPVLVAMVVTGIGNASMITGGLSLLQRLTPNEVTGRALGALGMAITLGVAAGSALAAPLLEIFGIRGLLLGIGVLWPAVALAMLAGTRRAEAQATARDADIELLRGPPFLSSLPLISLEGAAANLVHQAVPAGTALVHQGAHGDRFYLVTSGRAWASIDGKPVASIGPGEHFGELALLHDVPRLATVRMECDGSVAYLSRRDFLQALAVGTSAAEVPAPMGPTMAPVDSPAGGPKHDLLARQPMFRRSPIADLETLAARAAEVTVDDGEEVYAQGDPADDFYVVLDGAVEVVADGHLIARIERGGWFGELALLHDEPRRASIRSAGTTTLMRIDGSAFLQVMAASSTSAGRRAQSTARGYGAT